jgi:glycosyltransferase involved in cell wall biosynthesis
MKIAIFTELYPPHMGGQEIRFADIGETLVRRGHDVAVYCIGHSRSLPNKEVKNGVRIFRYPFDEKYTQPIFKPLKRRLITLLLYSFWCRNIAQKESFDLLLYNQWPIGHIMMAPKKVRSKSVIDWCEIRNNKIFQYLQRTLPKKMKYNMAVSSSVKEHIRHVSGCAVSYIPSGIYADRYRSESSRTGLLYLGRITEHKNITLLLHAYSELKLQGFNETLTIAGAGPHLQQVIEEINQLNLVDSVKVLGSVSEEEKINLLSTAKLLVIPSKREGFPRVVAEAMASGLPVVTVDYPENGTKTVVKQYQIGVVSQPDKKALCQDILQVLSKREGYAKTALERAHELDWEHLINQIEDMYMKNGGNQQ